MRHLDRYDRYDWIGLLLVALVAALWVAHFVVPSGGPAAPV